MKIKSMGPLAFSQAPKQCLTFKGHSRRCAALSENANLAKSGKIECIYATLSDYLTTYDLNYVRKFQKACLNNMVQTRKWYFYYLHGVIKYLNQSQRNKE